jgi:hypothetical protein
MQSLPWIVLNLFHAQADSSRLGVNTQDFYFDTVTRIHQFARMLYPFRPAHFRNMHQTFDAILKFYEGTVIGDAGDSARHSRSYREAFINTGPGIRKQLFISERNAFAILIKLQDLHLNIVANSEELAGI